MVEVVVVLEAAIRRTSICYVHDICVEFATRQLSDYQSKLFLIIRSRTLCKIFII